MLVCEMQLLWRLANDWRLFGVFATGFLIYELALGLAIINRVAYTEIDWVAYMQEVEGVHNGTYDYTLLRGDTGPLVYPGGFVWLYSLLYHITDAGTNIRLAQHIFLGLYLAVVAATLVAARQADCCPPWAIALLGLSKRIHSIFMLRLFNDCWALFFFLLSLIFFQRQRWGTGCLLFSAATSIKMNILLFAPGLFTLLMQAMGPAQTLLHIGYCAALQLLVAVPFLFENFWGYVGRAFEFSRVFMYKWTVNWKFLDPETFVNRQLALALLALHALTLLVFLAAIWTRADGGVWDAYFHAHRGHMLERTRGGARVLSPRHITLVLLQSNFVGIVFARTLHYQFYSWYFFSLPFLFMGAVRWGLGDRTRGPRYRATILAGILCMAAIELAFNVYPATWWSSLLLQAAHLTMLFIIWTGRPLDPSDHLRKEKRA